MVYKHMFPAQLKDDKELSLETDNRNSLLGLKSKPSK